MAGQRLGGLSFAAALLDGGVARPKLRDLAAMVGRAKRAQPASLARDEAGGLAWIAWRRGAGGGARNWSHAPAGWRQRRSALAYAHCSCRRKTAWRTPLARGVYSEPALIPASPWLSDVAPPTPTLALKDAGSEARLSWEPAAGSTPWLWALAKKVNGHWDLQILPGAVKAKSVPTGQAPYRLEETALAAVDRYGNLSPWVTRAPAD